MEKKMDVFRNYRELGDRYRGRNVNQAYLCYENALYFERKGSCSRPGEIAYLKNKMEECRNMPDFTVKSVAVVLVSYNNFSLTKACIESIRQHNDSETYELIVVDNSSEDGVAGWLRQQEDIILIENLENMGFPHGCNQGIERAKTDSDIFLLNNDTIVPCNAIFWLRMGLYESSRTGAAGSISNNAVNYQQVSGSFAAPEEWMRFAEEQNVPMERPYEKKAWLMGFAMLIKRTALEAVREDGQVLDLRFSPGNYEDNDLGLRLLKAGYQLLLCKNSFIYHYGGSAFGKDRERYSRLLRENEKKLEEKHGAHIVQDSQVETAILDMIRPQRECFSVLQAGCRLGTTLAKLESRFEGAQVLGVERKKELAQMAASVTNVRQEDFLESQLFDGFDYILLDDILKPNNRSEELLKHAKRCLNPGGRILAAVKNTQCVRTIPQSEGYSLDEIAGIFCLTGLQIRDVSYRSVRLNGQEQAYAVSAAGGENSPQLPLYTAEKFIFELE